MAKFKPLLLCYVFALLILPAHRVLADTGPKPQMGFEFKGLEEAGLAIVSGVMYECNQADCSDAEPLKDLGPQGLYCEPTSCRAIGYGFAPYHILEIEFSDGTTRRSNIFETAGFESRYRVTVQPDDLLVEAQFSLGGFGSAALILACVCILGLGLMIGLIVLLTRRSQKK